MNKKELENIINNYICENYGDAEMENPSYDIPGMVDYILERVGE